MTLGGERELRKHFMKQGFLSLWPPGQRRGKEKKYRLLKEHFAPISHSDFRIEDTLFGPRTVGTEKRPKEFDIVATPIPRRAELIVIELKAEAVTAANILQLLGYINYLRFLQRYLGTAGRRKFSKRLGFRFTSRTRLRGILIGKSVGPGLLDKLPEEVLDIITLCTFRVAKGRWPGDLQKVLVHDRTYPLTRERAREGRMLRSLHQGK